MLQLLEYNATRVGLFLSHSKILRKENKQTYGKIKKLVC